MLYEQTQLSKVQHSIMSGLCFLFYIFAQMHFISDIHGTFCKANLISYHISVAFHSLALHAVMNIIVCSEDVSKVEKQHFFILCMEGQFCGKGCQVR